MRRCITLTSFLAIALAFAASASARPGHAPLQQVGPARPLVAQSSCSEAGDRILDWAAYWAVESQFHHYRHRGDIAATSRDEAAPQKAAPAPAAGRASSGPASYTGTNVQELGVDEADLVKTDGRHVYTINGRDVVIVKSWPAARSREVARYQLPAQVAPHSLFLEDDRLVVLSHVHEQHENRYFHGTRVSVLDVSDRRRPRLLHEADVEGSMAQARMIGDDVYLVANASLAVPPSVQQLAEQRAQELTRNIDQSNAERMMAGKLRAFRAVRSYLERTLGRRGLAVLPRQRHARAGGAMSRLRPLYGCADLLVPAGGSQLGTLSVVHFDIDQPERIDAVGVMAAGWQVYASQDALYTAMPNYGWFHMWGWGPQPSAADFNSTNIHKFDLRGEGDRPRYVASGRVRGHILNQFSMSEHDGHLRVATTDPGWRGTGQTSGETGNHLYVLAERGRRLSTIGAIEDLAPGERIYSARMMGDKGYMVTFKQTDPLFTLDLSNPRRPRVAGELKINGFSSYIHPLDDDHLLTVGQDATDEGRIQGAHVQVFDVSDPARPRRSAHRRIEVEGGWSASPAQWDHHAFTYDPRTRVLALPMMSSSFLGLALLEVNKDSFVELGRISHADLIDRPGTCATGDGRVQPCPPPHHLDWRAQITRSIIMDDVIFSLSSLGLQVNALEQPRRTLARLLLARTQQSQER